MIQVDVIVTTYNRLPLLRNTMDSFFQFTPPELVRQIIVSNDGSTDGTAEYLEELRNKHPDLISILPAQAERLGLVRRFNMAIERCAAPVVTQFQDDVTFAPTWLERQLAVIDQANFITGYDAPEHHAHGEMHGYKLKHSSRFTQLTAERYQWDKFFPMVPRHHFPTPCMRDGHPIGSGIDMALSGMRKNNPRSPSTFLVVPGVHHVAEFRDSTWRSHGQAIGGTSSPGGLSKYRAKEYWKDRAAMQGANAVGFANRPEPEQAEILRTKQTFLRGFLDTGALTVDFGCGVGHFAWLFRPDKYVGMDITPEFLAIARRNNTDHRFLSIDMPGQLNPLIKNVDFRQFMTNNVLQHNNDAAVLEILANLKSCKPSGFSLILYENTHAAPNASHMRFRTVPEYRDLIASAFTITGFSAESHVVHGQQHSVILANV